ncbi:MAG: helix-turn-helix transcriptional regulator [Patescibacteria group bacterium]|jgi:DNA-binding PadR family transcriptional regulator|nr:helix-turn-helix transcriptional regulator [Patescibacteria group bacterium]
MPRETITFKIFEILSDGAKTMDNLMFIFFNGYRRSYKQALKQRWQKYIESKKKEDLKKIKNNFYVLLNRLEKQGFIIKKKDKTQKKNLWLLTPAGRKKAKMLIAQTNFLFDYPHENDGKLRIIIFDIPEKERFKRNWLRAILTYLDFKMLQKSVWIGTNKIPERFIYDLKKFNVLPYVHIFEVSQSGTIETKK